MALGNHSDEASDASAIELSVRSFGLAVSLDLNDPFPIGCAAGENFVLPTLQQCYDANPTPLLASMVIKRVFCS
jgi:hypothetical protein